MRYPLFLRDTDGYMYRISDQGVLLGLEALDIEEGEYAGWDADGFAVELGAEGGRIIAVHTSETNGMDNLRAAIEEYARMKVVEIPSLAMNQNIEAMWQLIESQHDQQSWWRKFKKRF